MLLTPIFDAMKKFAIVGENEPARIHAKNIQRKAKPVAVCNADETAGKALAIKYDAKSYRSFDEMLSTEKEIDVVVVCSPVGCHAEHIIKSLQAGKDVLCESPLCLTKAAAWQIIETEKYCGQRVFLIQTPNFYKSFGRLKTQFDEHLIHTKSFILSMNLPLHEKFYTSERGKLFPGGGLLYDPFGSIIELMRQLFGEVDSVHGFKTNNAAKDCTEYSGVAALKMKNGVLGTLQWSGRHPGPTSLKIIRDNGGGDATLDVPGLLLLGSNSNVNSETAIDLSERYYKSVYDDLFKALRGKDVNFPTTLDGAKTVEAIENIYKALR